jgi:hypothetical protein
MEILCYSMLSFRACLAFYVSLDRARHSVEICGAWFAAIKIYENLGVLWPTMESMVARYSMALKTGFADVPALQVAEVLWYTCRFWAEHIIEVEDTASDAFLGPLRQFLTGKVMVWMEVLSSIYCFQTLYRVREWLQVSALCIQTPCVS